MLSDTNATIEVLLIPPRYIDIEHIRIEGSKAVITVNHFFLYSYLICSLSVRDFLPIIVV
jgi:hypothetical protein